MTRLAPRLAALALLVFGLLAALYLGGGASEPRLNLPPALRQAPPGTEGHARAENVAGGLDARLIRFLFGGGKSDRQIRGVIRGAARAPVLPLGIPKESLERSGDDLRFVLVSPATRLVGFVLQAPRASLRWEWELDGSPWPANRVYAGPFGLPAPDLVHGVGATCAHGFAEGQGTPEPSTLDVGAFVICDDGDLPPP